MKLGRCIKELERIYGIEHGGDRKTSNPKLSDLNQSDIAEMIGISVDTLNNYKKLTELIPELEDLVDTGILGDDATIIDVMQWMINTQLGRRNLPPQQRIAVVKKFEKKIQEQAKENMSIGGSSDKKGSPNGETLIEKQTHTDKELAKLAGVGTGTVARYTSGYLYMNLY